MQTEFLVILFLRYYDIWYDYHVIYYDNIVILPNPIVTTVVSTRGDVYQLEVISTLHLKIICKCSAFLMHINTHKREKIQLRYFYSCTSHCIK